MTTDQPSICCPYCTRLFGSETALTSHVTMKRRTSKRHGLKETGEPRSREEISAAIMEAAKR